METPEPNPDEGRAGAEESSQQNRSSNSHKRVDKQNTLPEPPENNSKDEKDVDNLERKAADEDAPKKVGGKDKKVSFLLPNNTDIDMTPIEEVKMRKKKSKKHKQGHRRESAGIVTYKKITTSELMGSIQLGLHFVIGKKNSNTVDTGSLKRRKDVLIRDFALMEIVTFPKSGSTITPAHNYKEFQFKSYAPHAFDNFRLIYDIDPQLYLSSL